MIDLEAVIYKHLMKNKMIDLEAITDRHLTKDKMEGKTFYEGHVVIDLYNCVEEIKRLRAASTEKKVQKSP